MGNRRVLNAEELLEKIFFFMNEMVDTKDFRRQYYSLRSSDALLPILRELPSGTGIKQKRNIGLWLRWTARGSQCRRGAVL